MSRTNALAPVLSLPSTGLTIKRNFDLTAKTSMKMRTQAAVYAVAESPDALCQLVQTIRRTGAPSYLLGGGKNTLFATSYFDGVVYSLGRCFNEIEYLGGNFVRVGGAVQLPALLKRLREWNLMGLEFLTMVPGTVGGSLAGNAGAGGWGLCDFVERVVLMTRTGRVFTVDRNMFQYSYRFCELREAIVLDADFRLEPFVQKEYDRRVEEYKDKKKGQPYSDPSCGCIFKNPKIDGKAVSAGKLIDEAELKGYAIRSAEVSQMHANFLINKGDSTGEDFLALIQFIRDTIHRKHGLELDLEVQVVGGPLNTAVLA